MTDTWISLVEAARRLDVDSTWLFLRTYAYDGRRGNLVIFNRTFQTRINDGVHVREEDLDGMRAALCVTLLHGEMSSTWR